jgi:hypothetical protein
VGAALLLAVAVCSTWALPSTTAAAFIDFLTPSGGLAGTTVRVTLSGTGLAGATRVTLGGTGVTATLAGEGTDTQVTVDLAISPTAAPGPRTFVVHLPGGPLDSGNQTFTVFAGPIITFITPSAGIAGRTVRVALAGFGLAGATGVTISGTGVTARLLPGGTDTELMVDLVIAASAPPGPRTFVVQLPGGPLDSGSQAFDVLSGPTVATIAPSAGIAGRTVRVGINGFGLSGATAVMFSGPGVMARLLPGGTDTGLMVDLAIAASAPPGPRTFIIQLPGGPIDSGLTAFAVLSGPTVATINPSAGIAGTTVRGGINGFGLSGALGVTLSGAGVTARLLPGASDTSLPVEFAIAPHAAPGARAFVVLLPDGPIDSGGVTFTVLAGATLATLSPSAGIAGTTVRGGINGFGLSGALGVTVSGAGVTARLLPGASDTTLPVEFAIAPDAAPGARAIAVLFRDRFLKGGNITFTVFRGPTIATLSPSGGIAGTTVRGAINGFGLAGATGVTVAGTGVAARLLPGASDTSLPLELAIAANAPSGERAVTVQLPTGPLTNPQVTFSVFGGPTIADLSPSGAVAGTAVRGAINGFGLAGAIAVTVGGTGVTARLLPGASDTSLPVEFAIAPDAAPGARQLTVQLPSGPVSSGRVTFTVGSRGPTLPGVSLAPDLTVRDVDEPVPGGPSLRTEITESLRALSGQDVRLDQDPANRILRLQIGEARFALFLTDFADPPPLGLRRQQIPPALDADGVTGAIRLTTTEGNRVTFTAAPVDLAGLVALAAQIGATGVELDQGRLRLPTADPDRSFSLRLGFQILPGGPPAIALNPDGTGLVSFAGAQAQQAFAVLTAPEEFVALAGSVPGVREVRVDLDGAVTVRTEAGEVRARPEFVVGRASAGTKRGILLEPGGARVTFSDGRRQRLFFSP